MDKYEVLARDDRNPVQIQDEWLKVDAENLADAIDKGQAAFFSKYPDENICNFSFGVAN